jgi:hypothetical protein
LTEAEENQTAEEQEWYRRTDCKGPRPRPPVWLTHDQELKCE